MVCELALSLCSVADLHYCYLHLFHLFEGKDVVFFFYFKKIQCKMLSGSINPQIYCVLFTGFHANIMLWKRNGIFARLNIIIGVTVRSVYFW